jgi:hypothetical protein
MDRRHGRPQELTGARPSATPGLKVTGEGAGEVEEAAVSTLVGSSELERWGRRGMTGGGRCLVGVCFNVGEEERGTVSGAGCFEGRRGGFYRARGGVSGWGRRGNGR